VSSAVTVEHLTRRFGDFTAVDDVTFSVEPGEIFGFLGPNGAGKTTTIKMLTGLLRPTSGRASVAGYDLFRSSQELKRHVGYMSQLFSLYADLTVAENIDFFGGLYGVEGDRLRQRRAWTLRMAQLEGKEDRPAGDLPLGWKQRLALGCAVLHEPPVLFLDEPTSGVDPLARRAFWDLIDGLSAGGTTVFVSTHYMQEAEFCHRLALMNQGRLIALDSPAALRGAMQEPLFELEVDDPPTAVEALLSLPDIHDASMFGRALHVVADDPNRAMTALPAVLAGAGVTCRGIRRIDPSLEDVFVSLIRHVGGVVAG